MHDRDARREIVMQGVFYALFRVAAIDDLAGPEKALEWARSMTEDAELRGAFAQRLLEELDARAARDEPAQG